MSEGVYDELAGLGYSIMEGLKDALDDGCLVDVDDGICYQRLDLPNGNSIHFQKWGPGSNWKLPFYLIPKIGSKHNNAGDRLFQLNLALLRPVGDKFQWYLRRPQRMCDEYEEQLGEVQDFPEDYREYVLNCKEVTGAGNDRPATGYLLVENGGWRELITKLARLIEVCYVKHHQPIKTSSFYEDEALNDPERYANRRARIRINQWKFRWVLRRAYADRCAITGTTPHHALDACHIQNHNEDGNNRRANGILLRADLHNLFDKKLLKINPKTYRVEIDSALKDTPYGTLEGKKICKTIDGKYPSQKYLRIKYEP
ncbi:HNH endonuclease signature motif containing protein [Halodesulfovibrio sp.]|jgi:hypothetical protein|uniref:HNH endonuclease n=1 Tax=Halodesulfovibrio sp. TaxID=1912772 RepID=UPI0025DDE740|nr:HNH endonuclease signature motif containing protein [Halodesulfovibrio sp.]MCT4627954.1 HNH endonuclease [Halodesulfovibrio sp.]